MSKRYPKVDMKGDIKSTVYSQQGRKNFDEINWGKKPKTEEWINITDNPPKQNEVLPKT
jgi:hypothetical protein